ncbi:hypothetical protein J2X14_001575 [Pantoea alhagi]|uniref:hypothetical protein n=1 Tax=Mixta sp. BE291 TaxID=3158787 RepID=UPI00285F0AAD|nr:hypothetical protein [Pantoea alhagi]
MQNEHEKQRLAALACKLQKRLEKVTPELLSEFLFERGIPVVKCLMCGNNDISIPQAAVLAASAEGSKAYTYVRYVTLNTDSSPFTLDSFEYRLICNSCGFTSHFAVYPVLKWVEEKDGKDA